MKGIILKIEILLTVLCISLIYSLTTAKVDQTVDPSIDIAKTLPKDVSGNVDIGSIRHVDSYEFAKHSNDEESLKALADKEARQMIKTGDVSEFKEELEKHNLLTRILGF